MTDAMYGLVDCNNFFVSCERVFNPALLGRPVVVLSNNDGCAVALSNEAKALGIGRGEPFFRIRERFGPSEVTVISGNHRLYGDMSRRVMSTLRSFVDDIEIYSVDEAFVRFSGEAEDYCAFGREIVRCVGRDTGVPVSIGIAPTRTLAKIAAGFAKKYPGYGGVCVIDTDEKRLTALSLTPIEKVWGIGRRHTLRLERCGVATALDFARMSASEVGALFSVVGVRTWRELLGEDCIEPDPVEIRKKSITSSRSFARDISEFGLLRQAMAGFVTIIGRKLREQSSYASEIEIFLCTNRFHEHKPQYFNAESIRLSEPTSDTAHLLEHASSLLDRVFRPGYGYKKAGVTVRRLISVDAFQPSLFSDPEELSRRERLFRVVDRLNSSPGNAGCVRLASMGRGFADMTRNEHATRLYTTRLSDIITVC